MTRDGKKVDLLFLEETLRAAWSYIERVIAQQQELSVWLTL